MVRVDQAVEARLTKAGRHFVLLVDCDKALDYKAGKTVGWGDLLASEEVYADARKGLHAAKSDLVAVFGTEDIHKIAEKILKEGEIAITAEHQRRLVAQLKRQIVDAICRNAINPQTNTPHPPARIESAMDAARVPLDIHKSADAQMQDIVHKLVTHLPIRLEVRELQIQVPASFAQSCFHVLKSYGTLKKQDWLSDGSLLVVVMLPAGQQEAFEKALGHATKGNFDLKIRSS